MKKAWIWIVIAALVVGVAIGVWQWLAAQQTDDTETSAQPAPAAPHAPVEQTGEFQIWQDTPIKTYARGERGSIAVHLKNNTGADYAYQGSYYSFHPTAKLILCDDAQSYEIAFDELPMTMEFAHYVIANGEVRDTTFTFVIPNDAPSGDYEIEMSFGGCTYRQIALTVND